MRLAWANRFSARPFPSSRTMTWGLLALALGVRLWKLGDQSLWFDEAMTVFWASQPVARILHVGLTLSQDPHPPLYYLLARALVSLRPYEVWLRLPSVVWGVLTVWAGMRVARLMVGTRMAWFVGAFLALNPTLVWYSQEARMYAQAIALLLIAWWLWLRFLQQPHIASGVGYLLAVLAAIYSYVLSLIWLPAQVLAWLFVVRQGRRRVQAAGFLGLAGGLSLPIAWQAWRHSGKTVLPHPVGQLPGALWHLWLAWLLGKWNAPTWVSVGVGGLTLILLLVALGWPDPERRSHWWVISGGIPLLVGIVLAHRDVIVLAEVRYLLIALPGLVLAWAYALQRLAERWLWPAQILAVLLLLSQGMALPSNWVPAHRREDWRYTAQYLERHMGPKDAILIHPDYVRVALEIYLNPALPRYAPFHDYVRPGHVAAPLTGLAERYDTVWLVESHTQTFDPKHLVSHWLASRFPLVTAQYPNGIVLQGYATHYRYADLPIHIPRLGVSFKNGLQLVGCRIWDTRLRARDDRAHPPSGWVHVSLYWEARHPLGGDVRPLVWLADRRGVWGARLVRRQDVWHRYQSSRWPVGEVVRDEEDINLNPATPAGRYTVLVGLQRPNGEHVPTDGGQPWAPCGRVQVIP